MNDSPMRHIEGLTPAKEIIREMASLASFMQDAMKLVEVHPRVID